MEKNKMANQNYSTTILNLIQVINANVAQLEKEFNAGVTSWQLQKTQWELDKQAMQEKIDALFDAKVSSPIQNVIDFKG